jgi:GNAT superfamily N-acetyltransferase
MELDIIEGEAKRQDFARLLNQSFPVKKGEEFFWDFPVWDEKILPSSQSIARFGVFSKADSSLVACTGVRMANLKAGSTNIKVALVGGVATDPRHQRQGLATELVGFSLRWAADRGASAVFLWGSEHSLYQKLGFDLCGTQQLIPLRELSASFKESIPANLKVHRGWAPTLLALMKERKSGLTLSESDRVWIEAHSQDHIEWYYTGSREVPTAYAAVGRGIDLHQIVHEWGGEPKDLHSLFHFLSVKHPDASELKILGSPGVCASFGYETSHFPEEFHCLARILNPQSIIQAFIPGADLKSPRFSKIISAPEIDLPRLLFGPQNMNKKEECLALPLWFWGLDAT